MEELEIYKTPYRDITATYPDLYSEIFDNIDDRQVPEFIYTGYIGDDYVGFVSAYLHNTECIYIQYAGFSEQFQGLHAPRLFQEVVKFVHQEYRGIMFRIENTNIKAIKVALNAGFLITGIRFDGVLYIELMKEREDGR